MWAAAAFQLSEMRRERLRHWEAYNDFPRNTAYFLRFDNLFTFPAVGTALVRPESCSGGCRFEPLQFGHPEPWESTVPFSFGLRFRLRLAVLNVIQHGFYSNRCMD